MTAETEKYLLNKLIKAETMIENNNEMYRLLEDAKRRSDDQLRIARKDIQKFLNYTDELENYAAELKKQLEQLSNIIREYRPGFDYESLKAPEYEEEE